MIDHAAHLDQLARQLEPDDKRIAADPARAAHHIRTLRHKVGELATDDPAALTYRSYRSRIERAIVNSATYLDGYPTGGDSGSATGAIQSRTETIAIAHTAGHEKPDGTMTGPDDRHTAVRREIERWVTRGADLVGQLAPNQVTADQYASTTTDTCPTSCCTSCWRTATRTPTRAPGGRLCRWCEDTARALELDEPPVDLVDKHNRGQRITDRDVRRATGGRVGA